MSQQTRGLAPKQAATYIGIGEQTLRKQRSGAGGPGRMPVVPYARAGRRIIYLVEDLDRWLEARRQVAEVEMAPAPREPIVVSSRIVTPESVVLDKSGHIGRVDTRKEVL